MKFYKMWKSKGKDETMKNKKLRQLGKICAVSLALVMPLTDALPYVTVATYAEGEDQSGSTGGDTNPEDANTGGDTTPEDDNDGGNTDPEGGNTGGDTEPSKDKLVIECAKELKREEQTTAYAKYMNTDASKAGKLTWESGDTSIITVEGGDNGTATLHAIKVGTAKITVKLTGTIDGNEYPIAEETFDVEVPQESTEVSLLVENQNGKDEDKGVDVTEVKLTAGNLQSDATGKVEFYVDGKLEGELAKEVNKEEVDYTYTASEKLKGEHTFKVFYSGDKNYVDSEKEETKSYKQGTSMSLSVHEDKGEDIKSVVAVVSGLPSDATGDITFCVKKNDTVVKSESVDAGQLIWTYTDEDVLKGNYTFSAEYSGNEEYVGCSKDDVEVGPYRQNQKVNFEETTSEYKSEIDSKNEPGPIVGNLENGSYSKSIEYKDDSLMIGDKTYDIEKKNEKEGKWEKVTDKVSVENDKFTATEGGYYRVRVTVGNKEPYIKASSGYLYIYVQDKIDLSKLTDVKNATLKLDDKVYDGTTKVTGTYKVSLKEVKDVFNIWTETTKTTEIKDKDYVIFTVQGTVDVVNVKFGDDGKVSSYDNQKIKITSATMETIEAASEQPTLKDVDSEKGVTPEETASLTINRRPVTLGTNPVTVTNTSTETTKAIVKAFAKKEKNIVKDDSDGNDVGFVGEKEDKEKLLNGIGVTVDEDFYYEADTVKGEIKVKPDLTDLEGDYKNYELNSASDEKLGKLTVHNMEINDKYLYDNVNFTSTVQNQIYLVNNEKEKTIYLGAGDLSATVNDNKFFNKVMFAENKEVAEKAEGSATYTEDKIKYNESGKRTVYVYLTNDGKICSQSLAITYYVDVEAPTVSFTSTKGNSNNNEEKDGISRFLSTITFGIYGNNLDNKADLSATVNDQPDSNASGIKKCSYTVISTDEKEEIKAADIKENYEKGKIKFTEVENFKEGESFNIPIDAKEGNYVALVYAEDQVGNATIYASNGIMVDVEKPSIYITLDDDSTINTEVPYTGDVNYKVTLNDFNEETVNDDTVISGIKNYRVEESYINSEGKKEILETVDETIAKSGEYYTKADLKKLAKTYENTISQESNNITITVTATDQAGNKELISQNLMIDKTAPVVETSISSEASAKNGYYYNQDVTMTLKVTEKNFFTDKDHLTFDVVKNDGQEGNGTYTGISLAELKDNGIISNYEIYDDQDGLADKTYTEGAKTYTNERVNTIVLSLNQDAEYTITPHVTDLGGLSNEEADSDTKQHFVVDKTAPVISVEYSPIEPGYSEDSRAYTQENVTAKITINEVNFYTSEKTFVTSDEMEQMNFAETRKVALDGSVTSLVDQYKEAAENADWSANGYVRTSSPITFEEDANYIFGFTYTDLAGNVAVYDPSYFTVDDTAPTGEVTVDERKWASFLEKITFGIFKNTKYNVSMTSEDEIAGVKKTEYYKAYSEKTLEELENYENWEEYLDVFSVSPNEQFVIYEKITDKADNVTYVSSDGVIADDTKPVINISNKSTSRNGVFGGDVTLNIDVADPEEGATYSGLEKVWYEVYSTGNMVNNKEEVLLDNSENKVKSNQTWNGDIVIPASQFNSNDVKVQAHAIDFSGNQYDSEVVELKIDTTAPVASISFDNNNPLNGKYYNSTRTATITVKDRNFNPDEVSLNITNTHGTSAVVSGWSVDSSGTSDENVNTCTVAFTEDGDYTLNFSCVDLPGNQSNTITVDEFTIDKTVPTISVAFDNNSASNGKYYNAPRTATITIVEHNFNGSDVQTAINASLQASGITAPGVNGWTSTGDTNTATVYFGTDGDYSFTVNYTDLAGNAATVATVDSFTIDQTKPEIEIFDIENKSANNGTVAPGVKYSDVNYNSNGVELTITGCEHDKKVIDGTHTSIANGQSIKMADFAHTEDVDDIYTMHAKVTDMAGNSTEKEVIFSVNRFGSTYYFGDDTKEFLNDYYHNQEEDLTVVEINVDEIEVNGISAGHDGELSELKKGTDYEVKAGGNEASWKQYTYTINKENFEKEGQYNITIDSTDKATNKVNNKIKNANIEFVIDKTAPSVVVNGVENGKQYRSDSRDVDIAVSDNVAMGDMDVYVDDMDKAAKSYKSKELVKKNGKVTYTLGSSDNWQNIQVSVTDAAGNKAETELCKVLVTSNVIVQFYRNTMAVVVTLVVLVGIALIILLLAKRRRDEASEQ